MDLKELKEFSLFALTLFAATLAMAAVFTFIVNFLIP